jgi:hypothetical protein
MKIELAVEDVKSILEVIRAVDPTGIFLGEIGKKIHKQAKEEVSRVVPDRLENVVPKPGEQVAFVAKK